MRIRDWSSDVCSSDLPTPTERYRLASPDLDRRRRPPRTQSQSPKVGATISHHDCRGGADGQVVRVQATCPVLQTSAQRDGYRYIPAWRRLLRPRTATTSNIDYCIVRRWRHRFVTPHPRKHKPHPPA